MAHPVNTRIEDRAREAELSARLAVRLAALGRRGIYISDVLLEMLAEGEDHKPLQKLLLSRALNEESIPLDMRMLDKLQKAANRNEYFDENPLKLVSDERGTCVCLDEEVDTIEWEDDERTANNHASGIEDASALEQLPVRATDSAGVLSKDDTNKLFSADQLADVKLTLLTSTNANIKVEAIRKLWLSPLQGDDKVALFLIALRDKQSAVRAEAARGLGSLGLDERITRNLADACAGDDDERLVALSNLSQLLPGAKEREQLLSLNVLVGLVDSQEPRPVLQQALNVLRSGLPPRVASQPDLLLQLHDNVRQVFARPAADLYQSVRGLYEDLMQETPTQLANQLLHSLEEVSQAQVRTFFVSLLANTNNPKAGTREVLQLVVDALLEADELDPSYMPLSAALIDHASQALPILLERFKTDGERKQRRLLPLLVEVRRVGELEQSAQDQIAAAALDAFEEGAPEMRSAIYDTSLLRLSEADESLRARAARLMLSDIHEYELETQRDLIAGNVLSLGTPSFEPAIQLLETSTRRVAVLAACELLDNLLQRHKDEVTIREKLPETLNRLLALQDSENFEARGDLLRLLGNVASSDAIDRERAEEVANLLIDESRQSSDVYQAITGLGWIASGDSIDSNARLELVHLLISFLTDSKSRAKGRVRPPERTEEEEDNDDRVLELNRDTTAHTVLIPRILAAVERILRRKDLTLGVWNAIVQTVPRLFQRIAEYRVVWAPASTLALAQVLGAIGASERADAELRAQLADVLFLKANVMPILQVLANLCRSDLSPRMDELSMEVFERLNAMVERFDELEITERRDVLRTLTSLLYRQRIGVSEDTDRRIRRQVLDALYRELRACLPGTVELLQEISGNEEIPRVDRDEINQRLKRLRDSRGR